MTDGVLPDPRLHAYRDDLADARLIGIVSAPRYVAGEPRQVTAPVMSVRAKPRPDASLHTQALLGETLHAFDEADGWAWVQLDQDGYVGYVPSKDISAAIRSATHRVSALRTYIYPAKNIKLPPLSLLSMNSRIALSACSDDGRFLAVDSGGFIVADHVRSLDQLDQDYVSTAAAFSGTPYLWGGRTSIGIDCSGLVQLALEAAGIPCPRDAEMQRSKVGLELPDGALMTRGDLVFWEGHVGIMANRHDLIHASAHHMCVVRENLSEAVARIAAAGYPALGARRLLA